MEFLGYRSWASCLIPRFNEWGKGRITEFWRGRKGDVDLYCVDICPILCMIVCRAIAAVDQRTLEVQRGKEARRAKIMNSTYVLWVRCDRDRNKRHALVQPNYVNIGITKLFIVDWVGKLCSYVYSLPHAILCSMPKQSSPIDHFRLIVDLRVIVGISTSFSLC